MSSHQARTTSVMAAAVAATARQRTMVASTLLPSTTLPAFSSASSLGGLGTGETVAVGGSLVATSGSAEREEWKEAVEEERTVVKERQEAADTALVKEESRAMARGLEEGLVEDSGGWEVEGLCTALALQGLCTALQ